LVLSIREDIFGLRKPRSISETMDKPWDFERKWDVLAAKKGTKQEGSRYPVLGFANSAHTFLKARISSRVIDLALVD
jgi:hypothetical protein